MKGVLIVLVLALVLTIPVAANAQDWVMDWTSAGSSIASPYEWRITGTSPTTLSPSPFGQPVNFSAPAYDLTFTWEGRLYGGPVSEQGNFQAGQWRAPAPCSPVLNCAISANVGIASGSFAFSDANHFALDMFVGSGHTNTHLVGLGHREGVTASAAEPAVLLLSGAGLVGAAVLRRLRRS